MSRRTMWKIRLNDSVILPEIYFDYYQALDALNKMCKSNVGVYGTVILYDDEEGLVY